MITLALLNPLRADRGVAGALSRNFTHDWYIIEVIVSPFARGLLVAKEAPFNGAVVYTSRSDIASVFRTELKQMGVDPINTPEGAKRCIEDIVAMGDALLVLDWLVGADKAFQVLEAVRNPLRAAIRPVFLFSSEEIEGMDGVAAEYGVVQMHIGEMTRNIIKDSLKAIITAEGHPKEIQEGLKLVADSRSRGDWETSKVMLEQLHSQFPESPRVATDLAQNYYHLGEMELAREILKPLCKGNPADARALNLMGRIQMKAGEFEEATVTLQRAKLINPFNIDRLCNLGEAYLNIHKFERAEMNFRQAVDLGSTDVKAVGGLGKSLLLGDRINEGLVFLKQLSGDREMASVFNSAAVLSMRTGRFVEGMKLYNVALDTIGNEDPVLSKLAFNMGIGFIRQEDAFKAAQCFAIAFRFDANNAKAEKNWRYVEQRLPQKPEVPTEREAMRAFLKKINGESSPPTATAATGALAEGDEAFEMNEEDDKAS